MNIINARPKSPCVKECENRTIYCKCSCALYKEYEERYNIYMKEKQKNIVKTTDYSDYKKKVVVKMTKRMKKS